MIKSRDIPNELKQFHKIFMQLTNSGYTHDLYTTFSEWMDMVIALFSGDTERLSELEKKYKPEEQKLFLQIQYEWIQTLERKFDKDDNTFHWYDALGTYYEILSSLHKRQAFGQFFTPEPICDLMAQITIYDEEQTDTIKTVNDPACGSGRTLLAAHCQLKGRCIAYAEDLDEMCAKMTVLNLFIHGVRGEVIHHDSLNPASFYKGWHVNTSLPYSGKATIYRLQDKTESHVFNMWNQVLIKQGEVEYKQQSEARKEIIKNAPHITAEQLSLF